MSRVFFPKKMHTLDTTGNIGYTFPMTIPLPTNSTDRWDYGLTEEEKNVRRARASAWNAANRDRINARNRHATPEQRALRNTAALTWAKDHPGYSSWQAARQRCTNPKHKSYSNYGARGITFNLSWLDMLTIWARDWTPDLPDPTLARIDDNGPFSLDNCLILPLRTNLQRKASLHWTQERRDAASRARRRYPVKNAPQGILEPNRHTPQT